jgi:hypothetical protein
MNLWDALGVSSQQGLLAAAAFLGTAILIAAGVILSRSRPERKSGLGLHDREQP